MTGWAAPAGLQVPGATAHVLSHGGEEWDVLVASPDGTMLAPLAGDGPYPVLYVTDPSATFLTTMSIAQTLFGLSEGRLLPVAVVGVGPRTTDVFRLLGQRVRDLTPTSDPSQDVDPAYPSGGSKAFMDLLIDHIAPFVEAEHNLDGSQRALAGLSLGGLFAATTLLERPEAFGRYLMVSPAMSWDDRGVLRRLGSLPADTLSGRQVYVGVGEHERSGLAAIWPQSEDETGDFPDLVADATTLAGLLGAAGARVSHEVIADEHHNTVWAAAVTRGIISLFGV